MKLTQQFVIGVLGLWMVTACHTSKKQSTSTQPNQPKPAGAKATHLINDTWVLVELNGYPLETDTFDREKPRIEIKTTDGMYFGYSGCNNLSGQIVLTETTIEFRPGPMTRKACIEGNIEPDFVNALLVTKFYSVKNGRLELMDHSKKVVCRFRKTD
jgi:heat shock protein HslJ